MSPTSGVVAANPKVRALNLVLVRLAADGVRPRCGEPDAHKLFLSEDPEERALAATWCAGCPIRLECADAGAATRANFGVWGGRDRTTRPRGRTGVGHAVLRRSDAFPQASSGSAIPKRGVDPAPDTSGPDDRSIRPSTTTNKEN